MEVVAATDAGTSVPTADATAAVVPAAALTDAVEESGNEQEKRELKEALQNAPVVREILQAGNFISEEQVAVLAAATGYLPKQVKRACTAFRNSGPSRAGMPDRYFHFMFNKQAGVYAQPQPYNPKAQDWKTLAEALPEGFPVGLPAAGRLDAETEGLVLFSDNRWLLHLLSQGTAGKASKSYHVWCSRVRGEGEGKEQDNADRYSGEFWTGGPRISSFKSTGHDTSRAVCEPRVYSALHFSWP